MTTKNHITWILSVLFTVCLLLAPMGAYAETETAAVKEDFDTRSPSGCSNVTSPTYGTNTYSIRLYSGWGAFEMSEFVGCEIEFFLQTYGAGGSDPDHLVLTLDGKDLGNSLEIFIYAASTSTTRVKIIDSFDGKENTESETVRETIYSEWAKIAINIRQTEDDLDGTTKCLDITINGKPVFEDFPLLSGEKTTEFKERKWTESEFRSEDTDSDVYLSSITIQTTTFSETYGYNWTLILVVSGGVLIALVVIMKRQSLVKAGSAAAEKITGDD